MTDVIMPQMGESIAEGTLTRWLKNVGDRVARDEPLFEISTDKVDAEIPAPAAGVLKEIRVQPGTTVPINTVVGVIGSEAEGATARPATTPAAAAPPAATPPPPPPMAAPQFEPEAPASAPPAAVPQARQAQADGTPGPTPSPKPAAAPPPPPAWAAPQPGPPPAPAPAAAPPAPPPPAHEPTPPPTAAATPPSPPAADKPRSEMTVDELRHTRSSPVVRRIAAEHQVDIRDVAGTGIAGRVTKQDILGHIEARASATPPAPPTPAEPKAPAAATTAAPAPAAAPPSAPAPPSAAPAAFPAPAAAPAPSPLPPAYQPGDRIERVPMSPIRRRTAEHMVLSKRTSAHVTTIWEIDMTRVEQLRARHQKAYEENSGVRLTYMPFILKSTLDALKAFPILNASVDGDSIVFHHDINIGIAVALDWGLIVPVIRNADEKNILGLARAVNDLADRARAKKLRVDEVQGGTFTITNPGVFGSLFGTPIINQPQVAILAVGTVEKRPVVRDDAIAIRHMAYFALTFDHRIVDGADADRFMAHVKRALQEFDEAVL